MKYAEFINRPYIVIFAVIILIVFGILIYKTRTVTLSEDENDICEVVFRSLFEDNGSGLGDKSEAYYIQIEEVNPTSDFLRRFDKHIPPVKAGWKFNKKRGLLFNISDIKYITTSTCEVHCGYFEGNLSAAGYKYKMIKLNGKWTIELITTLWAS